MIHHIRCGGQYQQAQHGSPGSEDIYTSGGAYSYLTLLLHLIEKHAGREIAILTSKAFMIDINRSSQSPFITFEGQKMHEDKQVKSARNL